MRQNLEHRADQNFAEWRDKHRAELQRIGLFPSVYLDLKSWQRFTQDGHVEGDPSRFSFEQLNEQQSRSLLRFLHREYGGQNSQPGLLRWLKSRHPQEFHD